MVIPKITGPDMLRAIKQRTTGFPHGTVLAISLIDSYDLFRLQLDDLTAAEFGFDSQVAQRVVDGLRQASVTELGKALGVELVVDKNLRASIIPNAGIIRSAGAFADDPDSLEDTLDFFDRLRHGHRADR